MSSMDAGSEAAASGPASLDHGLGDGAATMSSAQAQAYVDSLTAAFHAADMQAPSVSAGSGISAALLQATPVCMPLVLDTAKMLEGLNVNAAAPAAADPAAGVPVIPAAAPAGPTVISAPSGPSVAAAAAGASLPTAAVMAPAAGAGLPAVVPSPGALVPAAVAAPGAALLQTAALQSAQAAAAAAPGAAPAVVPVGAVGTPGTVPVSPTAVAAAAQGSVVGGPAPPTVTNVAALNAAANAANPSLLMPPSMTQSNVLSNASAALLTSAGLQQATAYVPTGASAAQVAAGMPEVQAVQVLIPAAQPSTAGSTASTMSAASAIQNAVASQQAAAQNVAALQNAAAMQNAAAVQTALANQRMALAGLMSTASTSSAMSAMTGSTLTNNTLAGSTLTGGALGSAGLASTINPSALGNALAASAGMLGVGSPASTALTGGLSYVPSDVSLQNLKSMSVASSVLSAQPTLDPSGGSSTSTVAAQVAALNAAAAAAVAGAAAANTNKKVRVLLSSGGVYEEMPGSSQGSGSRAPLWRYVGGETRLVGLTRSTNFSHFLQQLSKATSAALWDDSCRLMYDLPGAEGDSDTLIDLVEDDDLEMMWEELDSFAAVRPGFRLHIYAQLGSKRTSAEGSSGTIPSADSNVIKESGSAGHARASIGTATDAPLAAGSTSSACEPGMHPSSTFTLTSSEYDEMVEDLVTDTPKVSLSDLEARLEIIKPEDLQPIRLLGTGGFGEVYLCHWHSCDVAVKCLNPSLLVPDGAMGSISKDNVSELLKEAALLGSVRHPNIVWVYGLVLPPLDPTLEALRSQLGPGQEIDAVKMATQMANKHRQEVPGISQIRPPALVTEFLASGSLRAAITRRADFLSRDSVRIKLALDAARGMDYLHAKSIVHFDLKTANLLVGMRDKTPICKVADFGLSKQKQQTFVTGVASLRGTLPWIAPEIIKTPGTCTEAVDVYSFGVVLWELWTLREPFEGINYHALLHMMSSSTEAVKPAMPGSSEFEGETPIEPAGGWSELVSECLATSADARPTFRTIVNRLEGMMRANRMAKRRTASSPAAGSGTSGVAATGVSA